MAKILHIALLGKSRTGNSILGRKAFTPSPDMTSVTFDSQGNYVCPLFSWFSLTLLQSVRATKSSLSAVTKTIQREQGILGSKLIEVVDGPGVVDLDTGLSLDAFRMFQNTIEANLDSAHVFLIVCRYGERFTEEDQAVISHLRKTYGQGVLKEHGVVVLT
ncbi:GTPase imap family member 6 [Plakobranchus ocellatus]|uniref:GTPase imap family member 6 n=1 Tax=Plakobranchus ocellatus TaxID=259542 RepID=A0AAV3YL21_9GAST|nr:GTPase imap family member 6 [Plakobranchus ocellatus]